MPPIRLTEFGWGFLLRLARSGMKACFHSVRVTTQQRLNTARLAARLDERSEFRQYLGACPEEPLLHFLFLWGKIISI